MKLKTKIFGEIDISDEKILTFANGIIGFPDLKHFVLLHDEEQGTDAGIRFLQSVEEPGFAMPVMDPLAVKPDYKPEVSDELLKEAGNITKDNILVLVTVTVPSDMKKMSVNLQGPFVINVEEHRGCQVILESGSYPVKFPIYDILRGGKAGE
jgi:flagellar assembly factor FliW